jgi:hypothetical protein
MQFYKIFLLAVISISMIVITGCGPRKFAVRPEMMSHDFTVVQKSGSLSYIPVVDLRNEQDKKGEKPGACGGGIGSGNLILGDENYKNPLLPEIDKHLKNSLLEAGIFTELLSESATNADYIFKSSVEQFHVFLNESKAQQTQACIGGILGSLIASSVDVEATTDIQLTGILLKGNEEVWRKSMTKHVLKIDDYSNTGKNLEKCMGEAIGACSKDLIAELARYLTSQ